MRAFLFVLILCATGCRLADLRPEHLKARSPTAYELTRGRELLIRAVQAQGGVGSWQRWTASEVTFRDEWQGLTGRFACPWPALRNHVRLRWRRDGAWTEAQFLDGPASRPANRPADGASWELEHGATRRMNADGSIDARQRESQRFILAAYPYLMELPFRLLDAPKVAWIGEREHDGRWFDLVLATWQSFEPHAQHDQFVLWIDRGSGRVTLAQYTIRDKYRWATGADHFENFQRAGPLLLPFRHTITVRPWSSSFVHRIEIEAAQSRDAPS